MDTNEPRRVIYIASQELVQVASLLPSNRGRSVLVHSLASSFGFFRGRESSLKYPPRVINPVPATKQDLLAYHDRYYVDVILSEGEPPEDHMDTCHGASSELGLEDDCPRFPGLSSYVRLVAGASLSAAKLLNADGADVAICWDGGRHHAHRSYASGFCYVADCVLAILKLKKPSLTYHRPKVMYIDLDLHFSDGVFNAFSTSSASSRVLTLSVHHAAPGFFPATPLSGVDALDASNPYQLSIPLHRGASSPTFFRVWRIIERVRCAFNPDFIILQCGVDGLAGDPCGVFNWSISVDEPGSMGYCIQQVMDWKLKTLILGGGGYNSPNAARAWAYLTSIACGSPLSIQADIPDHRGLPLYQPSFTLDVPHGNMQDENTTQYLDELEKSINLVISSIE